MQIFYRELNLFERKQIYASINSTMNSVIILKILKNNISNMQRKLIKHINNRRNNISAKEEK